MPLLVSALDHRIVFLHPAATPVLWLHVSLGCFGIPLVYLRLVIQLMVGLLHVVAVVIQPMMHFCASPVMQIGFLAPPV